MTLALATSSDQIVVPLFRAALAELRGTGLVWVDLRSSILRHLIKPIVLYWLDAHIGA
jgi:hypothetical protein